ncbi:MAG: aspartate-semialdehyde dehydrogenase [Verrucomicrobiota bacterium]|jgi:aspartate-semialdehyde dehydrogenase
MNRNPHVAVVGATGAVGIEMIQTLEKRGFPVGQLTLLASARSAGKKLPFRGTDVTVGELTAKSFAGVDIALFSAGSGISKEFAPLAARAGCVVIDNSSAFRMDDTVPLVIPEINGADAKKHRGIIANPNCTTAVTLMALYPLHQAFDVSRIFASSYQAVSGTGAKAIEELERQVGEVVAGKKATMEVYQHQIAFNVLPQVDSFMDTGYTREEMKMENEGRKIMHHPAFRASVTCVRVPVYRAHSIAVSAEFLKPITADAALAVLRKAPGLDVIDDPKAQQYPMPLTIAGRYNCAVGRVRKDCAMENGLCFWVVGDQLLKGAALNAVQIAEVLLQ